MRDTVPEYWLATQMAPELASNAAGPLPTTIVLSKLKLAGPTTETVLSRLLATHK